MRTKIFLLMAAFAAVTVLAGCPDETDENCIDFDGDGFFQDNDLCEPEDGVYDCNDYDQYTYPGAGETSCMDGRDNDCDGGADTYGIDTDNDGVIDMPYDQDCKIDDDGDGIAEQEGDCDDTNPDIYPDAESADRNMHR